MNTEFNRDNCESLHIYLATGSQTSAEKKKALRELNFFQLAIFYRWVAIREPHETTESYLTKYLSL